MSQPQSLPLILIVLVVLTQNNVGVVADAGNQTSLTAHDPIVILGDSGFTEENGVTTGSGSVDDPYIIEDWTINASLGRSVDLGGTFADGQGILIVDTTANFVVRNVHVHSGLVGGEYQTPKPGILLLNVMHARIEGSTFTENYVGILALSVKFSLIRKNLLINNTVGIDLTNYSTANLLDRNVIGKGVYGVEITAGSRDNVVSNNRIEEQSVDGILLVDQSTSGNSFVNNVIRENRGNGITMWSVSSNVFTSNFVMGNNVGFLMRWSDGNELHENIILSNNVGLQLITSPPYFAPPINTITGNYVVHNKIGILLCKSPGNVLEPNVVVANQESFVEYTTC